LKDSRVTRPSRVQITPPLNALFKSAQGANIAVGYTIDEQIAGAYTVHEAMQLNVAVYGTNLRPTARITAVLLNRWEQNGVTRRHQSWTKQLNLAQQREGMVAFTVSIADAALVRYVEADLLTIGAPQVAVLIDEVWQGDPLQRGMHNFNFAWMLPRSSVARH
jgi:hypothetical protein